MPDEMQGAVSCHADVLLAEITPSPSLPVPLSLFSCLVRRFLPCVPSTVGRWFGQMSGYGAGLCHDEAAFRSVVLLIGRARESSRSPAFPMHPCSPRSRQQPIRTLLADSTSRGRRPTVSRSADPIGRLHSKMVL